jgi:hypothetical protein
MNEKLLRVHELSGRTADIYFEDKKKTKCWKDLKIFSFLKYTCCFLPIYGAPRYVPSKLPEAYHTCMYLTPLRRFSSRCNQLWRNCPFPPFLPSSPSQ